MFLFSSMGGGERGRGGGGRLATCFSNTNPFPTENQKTNVLVSDLIRHKPGCTATEDGSRLEISDLESRGIVLSV